MIRVYLRASTADQNAERARELLDSSRIQVRSATLSNLSGQPHFFKNLGWLLKS
ncbi:hypothetical protein GCM10027295_19800 [Pseudaeromonas pectinilytica]